MIPSKKLKPNFNECLSEAFNAEINISGLGEIPVNKLFVLAIFFLGFINSGFWFLGIALEMIYLCFLSTNPRFHKFIEGKKLQEIKNGQIRKRNEIIASLDRENQGRLRRLNSNLTEINKLMSWNDDESGGFMNQSRQTTLNQLPNIFLKLLKSKQLIQENLQRSKIENINTEIKKLEKQLESTNLKPIIENSLRSNIDIHRRRLETITITKENELLVNMELNRIESQLHLVREEIVIDSSPEGLSSNIDRINSTLGETQSWINSNSDFLRKLGGPPIDTGSSIIDSEPIIPFENNRELE